MDGITDEHNSDLRYFTLAGERVARSYSAADFLACPETRELLVAEEEDRYREHIETVIISVVEHMYTHEREMISSLFAETTAGKLAGQLTALVRRSIEPDYKYSMFGDNPELAAPLVAFIDEIINGSNK
jgi:hypothetical protein